MVMVFGGGSDGGGGGDELVTCCVGFACCSRAPQAELCSDSGTVILPLQ